MADIALIDIAELIDQQKFAKSYTRILGELPVCRISGASHFGSDSSFVTQ